MNSYISSHFDSNPVTPGKSPETKKQENSGPITRASVNLNKVHPTSTTRVNQLIILHEKKISDHAQSVLSAQTPIKKNLEDVHAKPSPKNNEMETCSEFFLKAEIEADPHVKMIVENLEDADDTYVPRHTDTFLGTSLKSTAILNRERAKTEPGSTDRFDPSAHSSEEEGLVSIPEFSHRLNQEKISSSGIQDVSEPVKDTGDNNELFKNFAKYLTVLSDKETAKFKKLSMKGETVELQDRSKQLLKKYLGFFFSRGKSKETQAALNHILTTIHSEIKNGKGYYVDEKGNKQSLQKLADDFLATDYAQNIIKHSPEIAKSIASPMLEMLKNATAEREKAGKEFGALEDAYLTLNFRSLQIKEFDGEKMLQLINDLSQACTSLKFKNDPLTKMQLNEVKQLNPHLATEFEKNLNQISENFNPREAKTFITNLDASLKAETERARLKKDARLSSDLNRLSKLDMEEFLKLSPKIEQTLNGETFDQVAMTGLLDDLEKAIKRQAIKDEIQNLENNLQPLEIGIIQEVLKKNPPEAAMNNVFAEIIQSENIFLRNMENVLAYVEVLKKNNLLSEEDYKLFSTLPTLIQEGKNFVTTLNAANTSESKIKAFHDAYSPNNVKAYMNAFIDLVPKYNEISTKIKKAEETEIGKQLAQVLSQTNKGQDSSSLIINIVQRIPRHVLLQNELIKKMPKDLQPEVANNHNYLKAVSNLINSLTPR